MISKNFSPVKNHKHWGVLEKQLWKVRKINIEKVLKESNLAFRHDIWQRLYNPYFNVDPFKLSPYRIYFVSKLFKDYCTQENITLTNEENELFISVLRLSLSLLYRGDKNVFLSDENTFMSEIEFHWSKFFEKDLIIGQNLSEFKGMRKAIEMILNISQVEGDTERNLTKIVFTSFGVLIEMVMYERYKTKTLPKPTLGIYLNELGKEQRFKPFLLIFKFFTYLRNTIHIENLIRNNNLNYNLDSARLLYYFLLITLLAYKEFDLNQINLTSKIQEEVNHLYRFAT